jgi:hypothetical protein
MLRREEESDSGASNDAIFSSILRPTLRPGHCGQITVIIDNDVHIIAGKLLTTCHSTICSAMIDDLVNVTRKRAVYAIPMVILINHLLARFQKFGR